MSAERKTIGDKNYVMAKYMVEDGLELLGILQKKFAKPLGIFVGGLMSGFKGHEQVNLAALLQSEMDIPALFESLFEKLEPKEIAPLAKQILQSTKVQVGNELHTVDLNMHFIGNYLALFKLLGAVVSYQYSDFLGGLFAKAGSTPVAKENRIKALST